MGQWPKAAEAWLSTEPGKYPGDRLHNIGAAYESTFYELYWRGEPVAKLQSALNHAKKYHDDAMLRDPKEKAHSLAQERIGQASSLLQKLQGLAPVQAAAVPNLSLPIAANGLQPAVQQEFRRLIRMRIRNLAVTPENERASLEATAVQAFQLSPEEAKHHIESELQPWLKIRDSLLTYKATFDAFNQDQKILREERQILRGLAARLALAPDDIKLVEIPGSFTDIP